MFTVEHEFESTIITLVDDVASDRKEDIKITILDDKYVVEQIDGQTDEVKSICFSLNQIRSLAASLTLPEGAYTSH